MLFTGQQLLDQRQVGDRIFDLHTASEYLAGLRSILGLLEVPRSQAFTSKCFRAGKASQLAACGFPLHQVLQSGDWKSAAILNYADEDLWQLQGFLEQAAGLSDEEETA